MQTLLIPFQTGSPLSSLLLEENLSEKKSVESGRRLAVNCLMNFGQHSFMKGLLFISQSLTFMSEIESQNPHDTVSNSIRFNYYEYSGTIENTPKAPTSTIIVGIVALLSFNTCLEKIFIKI